MLAASVALNLLIAALAIWLTGVPRPAYLTRNLGTKSLSGRIVAQWHASLGPYFVNRGSGWQSLCAEALALPVLGASVPGSVRRRAGLFVLGVAICVVPIGYGFGRSPMRAASGLLFVVPGAAGLAVAGSPRAIAFFVKCAVVYLALQNCVTVNDLFHYESMAWDADRSLAVQLAARIDDVALDVHGDGAVRALFVGSYVRRPAHELPDNQAWVGAFDTWGTNLTDRRQRAMKNAGFPPFRLATEDDYRAAQPLIERMPAWPDPHAVARAGDVVVKLGVPNGFARSW